MRFDPYTGKPVQPFGAGSAIDASRPITGATVQLTADPTVGAATASEPDPVIPPAAIPGPMPAYVPANTRARRPRLGLILVGIGILALADQIGIAIDFLFPLALISLGIFLLMRRAR